MNSSIFTAIIMDLDSYRLNIVSSSIRAKRERWHGHNRNSEEWVQKAQEGGKEAT